MNLAFDNTLHYVRPNSFSLKLGANPVQQSQLFRPTMSNCIRQTSISTYVRHLTQLEQQLLMCKSTFANGLLFEKKFSCLRIKFELFTEFTLCMKFIIIILREIEDRLIDCYKKL